MNRVFFTRYLESPDYHWPYMALRRLQARNQHSTRQRKLKIEPRVTFYLEKVRVPLTTIRARHRI